MTLPSRSPRPRQHGAALGAVTSSVPTARACIERSSPALKPRPERSPLPSCAKDGPMAEQTDESYSVVVNHEEQYSLWPVRR
ncbi:MbtH family NRPS accessory protein [Actinacidiphila oryziradicis]|uniref:MbtH family protein n=1 Tax=Actinacidiphila oryziradicis TaxID=2571141 RepID=A0A4U0RK79_9ACTN|nr:MbtH family protein [Actinacidiphila oryziradicis]